VVTANDVLSGRVTVGRRVIIIGAGEVGCETADYAAERGARQITVVEMLRNVAYEMVPWSKEFLLERLDARGGRILTSAKVKEILEDGVVFTRDGQDESIRGVDRVVLALGARPVSDLAEALKDRAVEVHVIGDARSPRRAIEAIHEGFEVASTI